MSASTSIYPTPKLRADTGSTGTTKPNPTMSTTLVLRTLSPVVSGDRDLKGAIVYLLVLQGVDGQDYLPTVLTLVHESMRLACFAQR